MSDVNVALSLACFARIVDSHFRCDGHLTEQYVDLPFATSAKTSGGHPKCAVGIILAYIV